MERKMMQRLLRWMDNPERKALVSWGRKVGKTCLADEFARERYEQHFRLDFRRNRALPCMRSMPEFLGRMNKRSVFNRSDGWINVGTREHRDSLGRVSSAVFADAFGT